jgi:hypothetical protein
LRGEEGSGGEEILTEAPGPVGSREGITIGKADDGGGEDGPGIAKDGGPDDVVKDGEEVIEGPVGDEEVYAEYGASGCPTGE